MWPFSRRRSDAPEPAPAPYAPGRAEWRQLPPLQRIVGDQWLVNPPDSLSSRLASWQDPTYLAPLGHAVVPHGPSGAIEPAPPAAEPRRIDLQRETSPVQTDAPMTPRSLQRSASDPGRPDPTSAAATASEPAALQRSADTEPLLSNPSPAAESEQRPLLGEDPPHLGLPEHDAGAEHSPEATADLPMRSEPHVSSPTSMPSPQRSPQTPSAPSPHFDLPLASAPRPAGPADPVQPVATPFALQRMLTSDHTPIGQPTRSLQTSPPTPVVASLLASTDPPERRELPVVAAPRPPSLDVQPSVPTVVQRAAAPSGDIAPLLGDAGHSEVESPEGTLDSNDPSGSFAEAPLPMSPRVSAEPFIAQRSAEPDSEPIAATAPLLGTAGLAAPIVPSSDPTPAAEPLPPMPIAPLVSDQSNTAMTGERHVQRLGLGSPMSGPPSGSAPFVQRASGPRPSPQPSTTPGQPPGSEPSTPGGQLPGPRLPVPISGPSRPSLQRIGGLSGPLPLSESTAPPPRAEAARPLPPPVMVMRSTSPSEALPVASRSIAAPEPFYEPDAVPEAPLLGLRPLESTPAADDTPTGGASVPEPRASEPGSAVAQRSTWSHMPTPMPPAEFSPPALVTALQVSPPSAGASRSEAAPAAVQRFATPASGPSPSEPAEPLPVAAAPVALQAMSAPDLQQTAAETPPQAVEAVVQRVAVPSVSVQTADTPATPAPAAAGAAPAADPAALLAVLYEPLVRRLRADLRVDRERRGRLTDL